MATDGIPRSIADALRGATVVDISAALDADTPAYPGDTPFARATRVAHEDAGYMTSSLVMSAHAGTHVDAPLHFIPGGAAISDIPARQWVLPALVIAAGAGGRITPADLAAAVPPGSVIPPGSAIPPGGAIAPGSAVLLRTPNSGRPLRRSLDADACTLTLDAARLLAEIPAGLVGIDGLSIEADDDPAYPVHRLLLGRGIPILEGLRLADAAPGPALLLVAPLALSGAEAAPARALLLR